MPEALISLQGAALGYGGMTVLENVSVDVHPGDFTALVGPNGAGKTTLFRGLLGLLPLRAGRLSLRPGLSSCIGYVPQREALDATFPLTAGDVVALGAVAARPWRGAWRAARRGAVDAALDRVGLRRSSGDSFAELSGGQRQRVLIARALVASPTILILDEPTAGVDAAAERDILRLLAELNRARTMTILMVSHRIHALEAHAKEVWLVQQGTVRRGSWNEIHGIAHAPDLPGPPS